MKKRLFLNSVKRITHESDKNNNIKINGDVDEYDQDYCPIKLLQPTSTLKRIKLPKIENLHQCQSNLTESLKEAKQIKCYGSVLKATKVKILSHPPKKSKSQMNQTYDLRCSSSSDEEIKSSKKEFDRNHNEYYSRNYISKHSLTKDQSNISKEKYRNRYQIVEINDGYESYQMSPFRINGFLEQDSDYPKMCFDKSILVRVTKQPPTLSNLNIKGFISNDFNLEAKYC